MNQLAKIQYILVVAQMVPKIVRTVSNKFRQYDDQIKVQQSYGDENIELSTIFQGDMTLEQHKQTIFKHLDKIKNEVIEFLKNYNFQKIYCTEKIKQKYYDEKMNFCLINLKEIAQNKFSIFTYEIGTKNEIIWLNKALTKMNQILILYFQVKFKQLNYQEDFLLYFAEILKFIQKRIIKRVLKCLPQAYYNIQNLLQYVCENSISKDFQLENLEKQFQTNYNLQFYQKSITETYNRIIEIFNKDALEETLIKFLNQEDQQTRDKFRVSEVIVNQFHKIIRKRMRYKILNSLQNYKQRDDSILKDKITQLFLKQLNQVQFFGGIEDKQINQNIQLIIFSIFWIKLGFNKFKINFLIKELGKYHEYEDNDFQQIDIQDLELHQKIDFYDQMKNLEIQFNKAIEWYNQNVDEDTNLLVICQIYMILANIKFKNQKLYFGDYDSDARNILFIIIQNFNDLKFGYFNHEIVKICENLTHNLQMKLYEDINLKIQKEASQGYTQSELYKQRSQIIFNNEPYHFLLQDTSVSILQSPSVIGKDYHQKHKLFDFILKTKEPIDEFYKNQQLKLLKQKYQEINDNINQKKLCKEYKFINILEEPKLFHFQTLSKDDKNSNVITLLISGFLSKNEDKLSKWKPLLNNRYSGTLIALHWESLEILNIIKQISEWFTNKQNEIYDQIENNQFIETTKEATIVGKCLAHYLDEGHLFGNRQINILCHSLGTEILLQCIHELDRFSQKKLINDIILFGGVADIYELSKRKWNSVSGSVHNMYTNNDDVLKYLFKLNCNFKHPCGLNPVNFLYKKIYNYDVSDIVGGHSGYWEKLDIITNISDFNSDYKILVKDVKEIY
ncbi:unnamed protein product [Paramecium primaurelia]|uniref:Uncharacterized protein n=1 Tax=Paramecium primaurelia TaxID=5886 RepID=A0A8S1N144_PARPR|nr:unnamed protein product [Paramecium primaurelia]